jgi:hypothetical protein
MSESAEPTAEILLNSVTTKQLKFTMRHFSLPVSLAKFPVTFDYLMPAESNWPQP